MISEATSPESYLAAVSEDKKGAFAKLRKTIVENLPFGFKETMSYGMIGYVVPKTIYPDGYHCDPKLPLPFMSIAAQKNYIALYHMGIYAQKDLYNWFVQTYPNYVSTKLDMGKSCIRFKNPDKIPFELIADLCKKLSPEEWIDLYENNIKK